MEIQCVPPSPWHLLVHGMIQEQVYCRWISRLNLLCCQCNLKLWNFLKHLRQTLTSFQINLHLVN